MVDCAYLVPWHPLRMRIVTFHDGLQNHGTMTRTCLSSVDGVLLLLAEYWEQITILLANVNLCLILHDWEKMKILLANVNLRQILHDWEKMKILLANVNLRRILHDWEKMEILLANVNLCLVLHGGNDSNYLHCPWSLPRCPSKCSNRKFTISL